MVAQRGARLRTGAQHQIGHARRQPRLRQQSDQVDRGVRGQLARLQHERVAGGERRGDLPRGLQQRVVPGRDQGADADRLVHHPAVDVRPPGVDHPAGLARDQPPEVAETVDDVVHVVRALHQPFAGVQGLGAGQRVLVPGEEPGDPQEQVTALGGRRVRPGTGVEGAPGRRDGLHGVLAAGLVHDAHQGAVGGTADLPGALVQGAPPHTVDEQVRHGSPPAAPAATRGRSRCGARSGPAPRLCGTRARTSPAGCARRPRSPGR